MLNKRDSRGKTLTRWCTCLCFRHPHSARAEKWCHRVVWLNPHSKWRCAACWKRTLYKKLLQALISCSPVSQPTDKPTVNATADHIDNNAFSRCFTTMQSLDRLSTLCDIVYKSLKTEQAYFSFTKSLILIHTQENFTKLLKKYQIKINVTESQPQQTNW